MAMIIPADHQQLIGFEVLYFLDKVGGDDAHEAFETGLFGRIGHEFVVVAVQQGNIPFDLFPKAAVIDRPIAGLLISVKDLYLDILFRQTHDPGNVVLYGMSSDDDQLFHEWMSDFEGLRVKGCRRIGASCGCSSRRLRSTSSPCSLKRGWTMISMVAPPGQRLLEW